MTSPSIKFYKVQTEEPDPIDWPNFHDRQSLHNFLAGEGNEHCRVFANGTDITVRTALEMAREAGRNGEYSVGYADTFGEFCIHFAGAECDQQWAEIERQHYEDIQYGTRFAGDWGYG